MDSNWKQQVTVVGAAASVLVLLSTLWSPWLSDGDNEDDPQPRAEYEFNPWAETAEGPPIDVEPPQEDDRWVYLVDDNEHPVEADVLVGAPGMWPFVSRTTDRAGFFDLPTNDVSRLGGRDNQTYKIVARSPGDEHQPPRAFWGMIRGLDGPVPPRDGRRVELEETSDLQLEIVDRDQRPIDGAYARLAQDSIGLVQLEQTSEADGHISFDAIPPDNYYLTLDADGFARTTVTVDHNAEPSTPLQISLDDGGGLRTPQAWRRPSIHEVASSEAPSAPSSSSSSSSSGGRASSTSGEAAARGASTGGGGGSPGSGASAQDGEDAGEPTVDLHVRVAEPRGAGVSGAWIEAWSNGTRVDEAESRGRQSAVLEIPQQGNDVEVVATHAGWGQGSHVAGSVDDGDDIIIELDADIFDDTVAADRITDRQRIEDVLQLELVDDGTKWLIDRPAPGSRAAEAGFQRSDALVFVRRNSSGHIAVVERDGQNRQLQLP